MADSDYLSAADLLNFNNTVQATNPYGIAGQSLQAFQPNMQTWSPTEVGVTSFAKTFLSSLLGNYARQDAADQMAKVVQVLPQLTADPMSVAVPEGVDAGAFNTHIRGKAALGDMMTQVLGRRQQELSRNQELGTIRGKLQAYGLQPEAAPVAVVPTAPGPLLNSTDADQGAEVDIGAPAAKPNVQDQLALIPGTPQAEAKKAGDERLVNLRKEFNALDPVKNFSKAAQAADALSGALKDTGKVSDQELVRYSILMIEPGMAVREGEAAAVAGSQSIPEEWKNKMSSALEGGTTLGEDVRSGIQRLASRAYTSHKRLYDQAFELYGNEAKMQGVDPSRLSYLGTPKEAADVFGPPLTPKKTGPTSVQTQLVAIRDQLKDPSLTAAQRAELAAQARNLAAVKVSEESADVLRIR